MQELCALLEKDKTRSKSLYDAICDQLQKMNLIDETWGMSEFEVAFGLNFYQAPLVICIFIPGHAKSVPESFVSAGKRC